MAANAGFNKTSQNDLVEGVAIDAIILGMNAQPRVFQDVNADQEPREPSGEFGLQVG